MNEAKLKYTAEELADSFSLSQLEAYMRVARRQDFAKRARDDLLAFRQYTRPDVNSDDPLASTYTVKAHHRMLGEFLMDAERGKRMRGILTLPPQMGKSDLATRAFVAWFVARNPAKHVIVQAYNQDFAETFGEDVRTLINCDEFKQIFPAFALQRGSKARDAMTTIAGGKLSFIGRDGSATGKPADLFIVDDPFKNSADVKSFANREQVWNFFTRVVGSRAKMGTVVLIVSTRWHEDDLIARIIDPKNPFYNAKVAATYQYINIPEIVDDQGLADALGLPLGGALWPERRNLEMLEIQRLMDPEGFSALHMGRPTPPEGRFFKQHMLRGYELHELPKNLRYYLTGDLALSEERGANHTCIGPWGLDEEDCLWLLPNIFWERVKADESVDQILQFATDYAIFCSFWEKGQIAKAVGPFLQKTARERGIALTMESLAVAGDKGARALSIRGRMMQGKVRFPVFAPWWPRAKDEILSFTGSGDDASDDFVDMCSLIGQALGMQVRATGEQKSSVVAPRSGSLAWVRWASERQKAEQQRRQHVNGW
jgi:predicted phage terminase large subunit-like protein